MFSGLRLDFCGIFSVQQAFREEEHQTVLYSPLLRYFSFWRPHQTAEVQESVGIQRY